jgi:predicted permease
LQGSQSASHGIIPEGADRSTLPAGSDARFRLNWVSPGYFATLGVPLRAGRPIDEQDRAGSLRVAVVNETFAARYWPGQSAVGKRFFSDLFATYAGGTIRYDTKLTQVVGVVADAHDQDYPEPPQPAMYLSLQQSAADPSPSGYVQGLTFEIVMRARRDPAAAVHAARRVVHEMEPRAPVFEIHAINELVAEQQRTPRFYALMLSLFGAFALMLAAAGVFGVLAYLVSQRTHEIGVRMALGAQRGAVLRLVMGQVAIPSAAGVMVGLAIAIALTRLIRSWLFEVAPTDPASLVGAAIMLLVVAAAAAWVPTRRATRIEPAIALRAEG